ncbi:HNH endonuclease [Prosthecobacter sp.]|uniref:HNH endonuclease n=1 Tax=Prosthecobacter sp. TaxID=1965333 RepID=UPI0031F2D616
MPNVAANTGNDLNAAYQIDAFQDVSGLILESWGPSARNADYNEALDVIIERLQSRSLDEIGVNVISRDLVDQFPNFTERAILLDSSSSVSLLGREPREIRLEIGRAQARLKIDTSKSGGNRTKRILLHSTLLTPSDWNVVASPAASSSPLLPAVPAGIQSPKSSTQMTVVIERDSNVRAWILRTAAGICELCGQPAPFLDAIGVPFLEVHHVIPLASSGPDTTTNAVALCPNCHRDLHYGAERIMKLKNLYEQIPRLSRAISQN